MKPPPFRIPNQSIIRAINQFERAVRAHAWKGGAHPEDATYIEEDYWVARDRLAHAINKAITKK